MLLAVKDVRTSYGLIQALKGVSLEVHQGEVVALIGANGAGKTTLLKTICGMLTPRAGEITYQGARIDGTDPSVLHTQGIVLIPEGRGILARMTVRENLQLGAYNRKASSGEIGRDIDRIFERFPVLAERRNKPASVLSGGEQQMLAISRALLAKPRLLLMDEPSLGLAPLLVRDVFENILDLQDQGITVLLVEQNAKQALQVADRAYVLETGRIVLSGSSQELLQSPDVQHAYLGRT